MRWLDHDKGKHPNELIAGISRTTLSGKLVTSLLVHGLVIVLTSVNFIMLCVKHKTLDPKAAVEQVQQSESATESAAPADGAEASKSAESTPTTDAKPEPATSDDSVPKIIEEINETSDERPTESDVSFDAVDEL